MSELEEFSIVYDSPGAVYRPGQTLSGSVNIALSKPMNTRGVEVRCHGRADVGWCESAGESVTIGVSDEENYVNELVVLLTSDSTDGITLDAGGHQFPFHFTLPNNIPSSFESKYGHVRYVVKAKIRTIGKPWKNDHKTTENFTVVGVVDLNKLPLECKVPCSDSSNFRVDCCCCWCWSIGKMAVTLRLSKSCFVPGETMWIDAEIFNNTRANIRGSRARLKQNIVYTADGMTRSITECKQLVTRDELIPPGRTSAWSNVPLVIPSVPPDGLGGCSIMSVGYSLKFSVNAKCKTVGLSRPIVIGTVPLEQETRQQDVTSQTPAPTP